MISRKYLLILAAALLAVVVYVVYTSRANATSNIQLESAVEVDTAVNVVPDVVDPSDTKSAE